LHYLLGPGLTGFELGTCSVRTEDGDVGGTQRIGNSGREGCFWTHHNQVDIFLATKRHKCIAVGFGNLDRLPLRATVPRGNPYRCDRSIAAQRPGQGLLAATATHDENPPQRWQSLGTG
jgi:hypothetical protein